MSNSAQWYILVFSLFNGRLVDLPGDPIPLVPQSGAGEVKHKVFLFGNLVLFIIKRKFGDQDPHEFYSQALLELVCKNLSFIGSYAASDYLPQAAIKLDCDQDFDAQPPVYAMLSEFDSFIFLSYDGTNFRHMARIQVHEGRVGFMYGMTQGTSPCSLGPPSASWSPTQVSDVLFSLLLNGYIEILAAVEKLSIMPSEADDVSPFVNEDMYIQLSGIFRVLNTSVSPMAILALKNLVDWWIFIFNL
jgi:hypothetical protein